MAVRLSVTVRGELVRKGLQDLTNAEAPKIGRQQMRTAMERIKRRMQVYPDEPAGQSLASSHPVLGTVYRTARGRYRRTGLLGQSWSIDELEGDKGYSLVNTAARKGRHYGVYVVGNAYGKRQAWMHQGRWQLLRTVSEEEIAKLPREILSQVSTAARRKGFMQ